MTNNDILRRLRFALNYTDAQVAKVISHTDGQFDSSLIGQWLKPEDNHRFLALSDAELCRFLDGLIIEKRGPRPDGSAPKAQERITRNEVLKKLRIALNLREDGMLAVFKHADFVVTKAELGSFFRKEGQRNFAECPEQVLRKFIHGLGQAAR